MGVLDRFRRQRVDAVATPPRADIRLDRGWRAVAPIVPVLRQVDARVAAGLAFRDGLASWRDVTFGTALGHAVDPQAPVGTVHGVIRYRTPGPTLRTGGAPLPLLRVPGEAAEPDGSATHAALTGRPRTPHGSAPAARSRADTARPSSPSAPAPHSTPSLAVQPDPVSPTPVPAVPWQTLPAPSAPARASRLDAAPHRPNPRQPVLSRSVLPGSPAPHSSPPDDQPPGPVVAARPVSVRPLSTTSRSDRPLSTPVLPVRSLPAVRSTGGSARPPVVRRAVDGHAIGPLLADSPVPAVAANRAVGGRDPVTPSRNRRMAADNDTRGADTEPVATPVAGTPGTDLPVQRASGDHPPTRSGIGEPMTSLPTTAVLASTTPPQPAAVATGAVRIDSAPPVGAVPSILPTTLPAPSADPVPVSRSVLGSTRMPGGAVDALPHQASVVGPPLPASAGVPLPVARAVVDRSTTDVRPMSSPGTVPLPVPQPVIRLDRAPDVGSVPTRPDHRIVPVLGDRPPARTVAGSPGHSVDRARTSQQPASGPRKRVVRPVWQRHTAPGVVLARPSGTPGHDSNASRQINNPSRRSSAPTGAEAGTAAPEHTRANRGGATVEAIGRAAGTAVGGAVGVDVVAMAPPSPQPVAALPVTAVQRSAATATPLPAQARSAAQPVPSHRLPAIGTGPRQPSGSTTTASTPASTPAPQRVPATSDPLAGIEMDKLARQLFEPLSRLFRADLRRGRERAGYGQDRRPQP